MVNFVAFPFFQTATINLVQTILPLNQTGLGIGIYQLFNFMAGGFAGAIVGKLLDNSSKINWKLNPLSIVNGTEIIYSNIFLGLLFVTLFNACILYIGYRRLDSLDFINNQ